jgi:hypothetical protein
VFRFDGYDVDADDGGNGCKHDDQGKLSYNVKGNPHTNP